MTEPTEPTQPAASRKTTGIRLEGVAKRFRGGVEAVRALDLAITPGEFVVLVGPSGCGSSAVTWRWCSRATPCTRG